MKTILVAGGAGYIGSHMTALLIASNKKAAAVLGRKPTRGPEAIISDAWHWHSNHPNGY